MSGQNEEKVSLDPERVAFISFISKNEFNQERHKNIHLRSIIEKNYV
jgi:hypothetical protein